MKASSSLTTGAAARAASAPLFSVKAIPGSESGRAPGGRSSRSTKVSFGGSFIVKAGVDNADIAIIRRAVLDRTILNSDGSGD